MTQLSMFDATILGVVEGLTEFLPVSSTGHLTITEKILDLPLDDPAITAYTAIIQMGAIAAVVIYFWRDLVTLIGAFFRGLFNAEHRNFEYRLAWKIGIGSIPVGIAGLAGKDLIAGPLRSLWVVAIALIGWSAAMIIAERLATQARGEKQLTFTDAIAIGIVQCISLIPGVSRSGATISAGLVRGLDRVTATRVSFLMSIPALVAAGFYELTDVSTGGLGAGPMLVGIGIAFIVGFASVVWLLRFLANHPISVFCLYRVLLGAVLLVLLGTGAMSAT